MAKPLAYAIATMAVIVTLAVTYVLVSPDLARAGASSNQERSFRSLPGDACVDSVSPTESVTATNHGQTVALSLVRPLGPDEGVGISPEPRYCAPRTIVVRICRTYIIEAADQAGNVTRKRFRSCTRWYRDVIHDCGRP